MCDDVYVDYPNDVCLLLCALMRSAVIGINPPTVDVYVCILGQNRRHIVPLCYDYFWFEVCDFGAYHTHRI